MGPDEGRETQSRQEAVGLKPREVVLPGAVSVLEMGPSLSPAGSTPRAGLPCPGLRSPSQDLAGRPAVLCLPALRLQLAQEVLAVPHLLQHPLLEDLQLLPALGQLLPEPGGHRLGGLQPQAQLLPRGGGAS